MSQAPFRTADSSERALLRNAVHDLRNPLAVLRATVEWLDVELHDRPDITDALGDVTRAIARLVHLTTELDVLESLHEPLGRVPIVLGPIVEEVALAVSTAEGRPVKVPARSFDDRGFTVVGDPALVAHVLRSALDAVVRGAAPGAEIEIAATADAHGVCVTVSAIADPGPFAEHDGLAGSGLTLYVASRIAAAHGGSLSASSSAIAPRVVVVLPVAA